MINAAATTMGFQVQIRRAHLTNQDHLFLTEINFAVSFGQDQWALLKKLGRKIKKSRFYEFTKNMLADYLNGYISIPLPA